MVPFVSFLLRMPSAFINTRIGDLRDRTKQKEKEIPIFIYFSLFTALCVSVFHSSALLFCSLSNVISVHFQLFATFAIFRFGCLQRRQKFRQRMKKKTIQPRC